MKRSLLLALLALLAIASTASAAPGEHSPYADCDNFDPAVCLQPFPNNLFTKPDAGTATGLRINFNITSMPRNAAGKPIDPTEWNRSDGFSPGSEITTYVPKLDLTATGAVPINNLPAYTEKNAPIVVLDVTRDPKHPHAKPVRWPIWAEMDANASSESTRNLIIRPAKNFLEGHTYVVALRGLRDATPQHALIPAGAAFAGYRDGKTQDARTAHMEWIFSKLAAAGIARHDSAQPLFLAWDFTVASRRSLSERMLHIRNDAFRQLGDTNLKDMTVAGNAPAFNVTRVEQGDASHGIARVVYGNFKVPCYISTPNCVPGGGFIYPPGKSVPMQIPGNTYTATFRCNVPTVSLSHPGTASLYGHGLFGSEGEAGQWQLQDFGSEHDFVFCATTWAGMGCPLDVPSDPNSFQTFVQNGLNDMQKGGNPPDTNCDVPNVLTALGDLSRFNTMIDRVQEGMLAFLYLGRLMVHPQGFDSNPAFQNDAHQGVIDISNPNYSDNRHGRVYYDGNSQGGIIGGSLASIMVDGNRASIGVPGMNYSTLLQRSTDFGRGTTDECQAPLSGNLPSYACLVYKAYPNEQDRQLVFGLMQMLWDRGEADGYAQHMTTDPYPDTPAHTILMNVAFGDHQVSNWAAAVEARTIGAKLRTPTLDIGRGGDQTGGSEFFGLLDPIPSYPYYGSAITVWDSGPISSDCKRGTAAPLFANTTNLDGCPFGLPAHEQDQQGGNDPHELVRRTRADRRMKSLFLRGHGVTDQCGGAPCHDDDWSGGPNNENSAPDPNPGDTTP